MSIATSLHLPYGFSELIRARIIRPTIESSGTKPVTTMAPKEVSPKADILVVGSVAVDLSCDFVDDTKQSSPRMHTSNPASIRQSIGGVGHNVALAAHRTSHDSTVKLCSMVGDDL